MKRKGLFTALMLFVSVALVSVGFAAWVITGSANVTNNTGSFSVETEIKDMRVNLSDLDFGDDNGVIAFTGCDDTTNPDKWLHFDSAVKENLSTTITATISAVDPSYVGDVTITLAGNDAYTELFNKNIVGVLPTQNNGISYTIGDYSLNEETNKYEALITITITFTWGTKYYNEEANTCLNPLVYYNTLEQNTVNGNNAIDDLMALKSLNGENYTLNIIIDSNYEYTTGDNTTVPTETETQE